MKLIKLLEVVLQHTKSEYTNKHIQDAITRLKDPDVYDITVKHLNCYLPNGLASLGRINEVTLKEMLFHIVMTAKNHSREAKHKYAVITAKLLEFSNKHKDFVRKKFNRDFECSIWDTLPVEQYYTALTHLPIGLLQHAVEYIMDHFQVETFHPTCNHHASFRTSIKARKPDGYSEYCEYKDHLFKDDYYMIASGADNPFRCNTNDPAETVSVTMQSLSVQMYKKLNGLYTKDRNAFWYVVGIHFPGIKQAESETVFYHIGRDVCCKTEAQMQKVISECELFGADQVFEFKN